MSASTNRRKKRKTLQKSAADSSVASTSACEPAAQTSSASVAGDMCLHVRLQLQLTPLLAKVPARICLKASASSIVASGSQIDSSPGAICDGERAFGRWWCEREPKLAEFVAVSASDGTRDTLFLALAAPFGSLVGDAAPELRALVARANVRNAEQQRIADAILLRYVLATNLPPEDSETYRFLLTMFDKTLERLYSIAFAPYYVGRFTGQRESLQKHMLSDQHWGSVPDLYLWQRASRGRVAVIVINRTYGVATEQIANIYSCHVQKTHPTAFVVLLQCYENSFMLVQRRDGQYLFDRDEFQRALPALYDEYDNQYERDEKRRILWRAVNDFVLHERPDLQCISAQERMERVAVALWAGGEHLCNLFDEVEDLVCFEVLDRPARSDLYQRLLAHGAAKSHLQIEKQGNIDNAYDCAAGMRRFQVKAPNGTLYNLCVLPQAHPQGDDLSNFDRGKVWRLRRNSNDQSQWWVLKFVETRDQVRFHCLLRKDRGASRYIVPLVFDRCVQARLWTANGIPGEWCDAKVTQFVGAGARRRILSQGSTQQAENIENVAKRGQKAVERAMSRIALQTSMNLSLRDKDWCAKQNRIEIDDKVLFHDFDQTVRPRAST